MFARKAVRSRKGLRWAALLAAITLTLGSCDFIANLLGIDPGEGGEAGNWNEAVWNESNWQ